MPTYNFICCNEDCKRKHKDITTSRYIMHGEKFSAKELGIKPCCKKSKLTKDAPCLVADNSFSWKRSVEPVWPNGRDPGNRIG